METANDQIQALRAELEEERRHRRRAELTVQAIQAEVTLWENYSENLEDSHTSMKRIQGLSIPVPDPLHPTGRCTCGGEGRCGWCKDIDRRGSEEKLQAVRAVLERYHDPKNEMLGSLTALQQITDILATTEPGSEMARLKDDLDFERDCLEAAQKNGREICRQRDESRISLAEARGIAKEALQNLDESEAEVTQLRLQLAEAKQNFADCFAAVQAEQRAHEATRVELREATAREVSLAEAANEQSKALGQARAELDREQATYRVYRETAEHWIRALQLHADLAKPLLDACNAIPENVRKQANAPRPTFRRVWAQKEAEGYQYGPDALEQVKFGWELAQQHLGPKATPWLGKLYEAINQWEAAEKAADQFAAEEEASGS